MPRLNVTDRDGETHLVQAESGSPLMFILRDDAGLPVEGTCGGCASCGTCHIHLAEAWVDRLPPREPAEEDMLDQLYHFDERVSRLACQVTLTDEMDGIALTLAPEE